jgi:hypothetical protein
MTGPSNVNPSGTNRPARQSVPPASSTALTTCPSRYRHTTGIGFGGHSRDSGSGRRIAEWRRSSKFVQRNANNLQSRIHRVFELGSGPETRTVTAWCANEQRVRPLQPIASVGLRRGSLHMASHMPAQPRLRSKHLQETPALSRRVYFRAEWSKSLTSPSTARHDLKPNSRLPGY